MSALDPESERRLGRLEQRVAMLTTEQYGGLLVDIGAAMKAAGRAQDAAHLLGLRFERAETQLTAMRERMHELFAQYESLSAAYDRKARAMMEDGK